MSAPDIGSDIGLHVGRKVSIGPKKGYWSLVRDIATSNAIHYYARMLRHIAQLVQLE